VRAADGEAARRVGAGQRLGLLRGPARGRHAAPGRVGRGRSRGGGHGEVVMVAVEAEGVDRTGIIMGEEESWLGG
jgi:hypothetical protein